ncbi:hypothetical protein BGX21_000415 [Mortierella sp. AD011]|nr:hypothetical protein BGX20_010282 [Mortierella sp. AD010]KAF9401837.1 hypothetical protein BGX21_000415 [Mortierella sp. AD011]
MYSRLKQQDEERERKREEQEQRHQRQRQKRSQSPFGDFFGSDEEDEEDDDARATSEACKGYYCADSDACVDKPIDCPCPFDMDTKCFRGDWYVCYRGGHTC